MQERRWRNYKLQIGNLEPDGMSFPNSNKQRGQRYILLDPEIIGPLRNRPSASRTLAVGKSGASLCNL